MIVWEASWHGGKMAAWSFECTLVSANRAKGGNYVMALQMTKMTLTLPEDLHRRVKAVAALQGTTISDIVRDSLNQYVAAALEDNPTVRRVLEISERIKSGREETYDWEQVKAELGAAEGGGAQALGDQRRGEPRDPARW
jgi:hypothetical protein